MLKSNIKGIGGKITKVKIMLKSNKNGKALKTCERKATKLPKDDIDL